jgi:hypothetical protein
MRISATQFHRLDQCLGTQRESEFVGYARARFPGRFEQVPDHALTQAYGQARARAAMHGIDRDDDCLRWFELSVMYGRDFDQSDWASDVLSLSSLSGTQRLQALIDRVRKTCPEF